MTLVAPARARLESVDLVRGIIMIIMALDHTRDYFGVLAVSPTDIPRTTVALFFTRWITHICAPVFFLLTGTGSYLALRRKSKAELSRFLLTRGLWLVFFEVVILRCFAYEFNFDYGLTMLVPVWALGWSMVVLSALVHLPARVVTAFGVVLIAGHNLLDNVSAAIFGVLAPLWMVLHQPGFLIHEPHHVVFVAYTLIPWVGVTALGYGLGQIYDPAICAEGARRRWLLLLSVASIAGFVVLRAINRYGDPSHWSGQDTRARTVLSFLNVTKYPPSLLYLLVMLGGAFMLLRIFDGGAPRVLSPALVYGRVPLFYYAIHFALLHLIAVVICETRYGQAHWFFESNGPGQFPTATPPGWGFSLPIVYLVWASVVIALYPLCRWFRGLKQRRNDAWLSYL